MRDRTNAYINADVFHSFNLIPHNILWWKNTHVVIKLGGKNPPNRKISFYMQHLDIA